MTDLIEVNFDGLVGPTHHYGGLGVGNLASVGHKGLVSQPRSAAIEGLQKMRLVAEAADPDKVVQAILPPQARPRIDWLRLLGFGGSDAEVLQRAGDEAPNLLSAAWSASSMWTANAACVSPAIDCGDGKTHLTVSNLSSSPHRSLEADETYAALGLIFADRDRFTIHHALPGGFAVRDEGAANQMRLSGGIEIFVHGIETDRNQFLPRQSLEAALAVARLHRLEPSKTFFLKQHPDAVQAGAFHNDVVATSCENVLLYHEQAFYDADETLISVEQLYKAENGQPLYRIMVPSERISLADAVDSYLFNSQLIHNRSGGLTLISPIQCQENQRVRVVVEELLAGDNPIVDVNYVDLRGSMWNGGGPACLRLRVSVTATDMQAIKPSVFWSEGLSDRLQDCIERTYSRELTGADLTEIEIAETAWRAVREVRQVLALKL